MTSLSLSLSVELIHPSAVIFFKTFVYARIRQSVSLDHLVHFFPLLVMAALRHVSRSARRGLLQLSLSYPASVQPIQSLYPPSHSHSCSYGGGIFNFEFSWRPRFNIIQSYSMSLGQNFFFSTSPGVADGSNCSSGGGKDSGRCGELKRTSETSWIDLYLPQKARPYAKLARLDKPIGTWLLAWPCMW